MRLIKKWVGIFGFVWAVLVYWTLSALAAQYIFVIDVSGSMRKSGLSERVKSELNRYIKDLDRGTRVIVFSFGSEVQIVDERVIESPRDVTEIQTQINRLRFRDQWTWMTKAFEVIFRRIEDLRRAYPEDPIYVYIFTDGNNDPPPAYRDMFTFKDLIRKYASGGAWRKENTFVYLIMFGIEPSQELKQFAEKTGTRIAALPPKPENIIKEIELSPKSVSFKLPYYNRKTKLTFKVARVRGVSQVRLRLVTNTDFEVFPRKITLGIVRGIPIEETINFTFSQNLLPGKYRFVLQLKSETPGVIVKPDRIPVEVEIEPPPKLVLAPAEVRFSAHLSPEIHKHMKIKVKELFGAREVEIILSPQGEGLRLEPQHLKVVPGSEEEIKVVFEGISSPGKYVYTVKPLVSFGGMEVFPSDIKLVLNVKKPFPWPLVGVIAGVVLLVVLIFLGIKLFCPRWPEGYYVVEKDGNIEIRRYEVRNYQKFCRSKVSSADMGIGDPYFELLLKRDGNVYVLLDEEEKLLNSGDKIVDKYYFEIESQF